MSVLDLTCDTLKKNLGVVRCGELPALPRTMITTPDDFSFDADDLATPASFKAAIQAAMISGIDIRVYLWPNFVGFESVNEDAIYEETALADLEVRPGKYRMRFHIRKNMCYHKAMFTHASNSGRVFIIDVNNNMLGTIDEETGELYGLSMSLLNPEKLMISDGSVATKSPVYMVLADSNEIDQRGVLVPVPFIGTLKRLTDVVLKQVGTADTDDLVVSVLTECDGVPVIGLALADFIAEEADGTPITITARTDNGDGTYALTTVAGWVDGAIVYLTTPALLTVKAYEYAEAATVDVTP
jgi:hypothetical protein